MCKLSIAILIILLGFSSASYADSTRARYIISETQEQYDEDIHGPYKEIKDKLEYKSGYYVGGGLGSTNVDPQGESNGFATADSSSSGFKIFFGQNFKANWAWELSYADLGAAGLDNVRNATLDALVPDAEIDYKVPAAWIKYSPLNPNKDFTIDLKAGIAAIQNSANDSRIGFDQQTSTQLALGAGVQWRFTERFFARFDVDSYDTDATYTGLSIGMYFVGKKKETVSAPVIKAPIVAEPLDTDKDGVIDDIDACPDSLPAVKVDETGCELKEEPRPEPMPTEPAVLCDSFDGVAEGVNFKVNSAELTQNAKQILEAVLPVFAENPNALLEVQAHTDSQGSATYNLGLSDRRAATVKNYLISLGVKPSTLQSQGYGENLPVDTNETPEGRARNRRVELKPLDKMCQ